MTWDEYYKNYLNWSDSTQIRRLSSVVCNGKSSEILEVACCLGDDTAITTLLKKAAKAGVSFSADEIIELSGYASDEAFDAVISKATCYFTDEQLEQLLSCTGNEKIREIAAKQGSKVFSYDIDEQETDDLCETREKGYSKAFAGAAFLGMLFSKPDSKVLKFRVGDHVRVKYRGQEGTIIDINGSLYMVSLKDGQRVDSYSEAELERVW